MSGIQLTADASSECLAAFLGGVILPDGGNDLDFWSGRSRKIAGVVGRNRCRRRAGADFDWTNQSADWAASGRHCLSWKEYGFLFSFGFFDFVDLGLVGFAVLDWEVAPLVLSSWFAVLS